jgi:predicted PurR-regulated permease PerM
MRGNIGIHPALVIFGLLAGEQLGGVAGIFLSIPAIAALIILEKYVRSEQSKAPQPRVGNWAAATPPAIFRRPPA